MKLYREDDLSQRQDGFEVIGNGSKSQLAIMVLEPGGVSGEYGNEHADSDQVLYVLAGKGKAIVNGKSLQLSCGDVLLIEAGELHEICGEGDEPLRTLNIYAPPFY